MVDQDNVVGIQDEVLKVIDLLTGGSEELEVISIIGMPGIGKKTLAKMIFGHPTIEREFAKHRALVRVSQDFSPKKLLLTILGHFMNDTSKIQDENEKNLAEELRSFLKKGKYLIIMEDVYTEDVWNELCTTFPKNNNKSRILLTTSIFNVAKQANPNKDPHRMRLLNLEESWKLLQMKALGSKDCPPELEEFGYHIAKECEGLPLTIEIIGGILLERGTNTYWWKKVAESINTFLYLDPLKRMEKFISLSFKDLPYHLKPCFLYFGMFPQDFQIPVSQLICLWIAEGFIEQIGDLTLEDIAEIYLEDLVNRNLVMVGKRRLNGKIRTCRVHDKLYDFCKNEASQEILFHEIKQINQGTNPSPQSPFQTCRRLCIHSNISNYISSKPFGPNVRSFLCFSSEKVPLPPEHDFSIPKTFKLVRVLDSRPINFTCFPSDLTRLVHLRYLAVSGDFKILPVAISDLWNMQTFIVATSSPTLEMKTDIWKMIELRHIETNASLLLSDSLAARRTSRVKSTSLQTLSTISPENCPHDVFERAPNLKKLGIRGRLSVLMEVRDKFSMFDSMGKLDYLENLKLLNDVSPQPPSEGKLKNLPQTHTFPPNLRKLKLSNTLLDWKHMSILGALENLEILKLTDNAFLGERWQAKDGGFRVLKVLLIEMTDLVLWKANTHHFPSLRSLYLKDCTKLEEIPFGFADVSSFQTIDLNHTTKLAADSARKIQQHKIAMQGQQGSNVGGFKLSIYRSYD